MRVQIEIDFGGVKPELQDTGSCYVKVYEGCATLGLSKGDEIQPALDYADGVYITYVSFNATNSTMEYGCYENDSIIVDKDFHEALLKGGFKPKKRG